MKLKPARQASHRVLWTLRKRKCEINKPNEVSTTTTLDARDWTRYEIANGGSVLIAVSEVAVVAAGVGGLTTDRQEEMTIEAGEEEGGMLAGGLEEA